MSFSERLAPHESMLEALKLRVDESEDIDMYKTGIEHAFPELHMKFIENGFEDSVSKWLRYQPDGILVNHTDRIVVFFDVKVAKNIELGAYKVYDRLRGAECPIILWVKHKTTRETYKIPFEDLELVDGTETVGSYPEPLPVDEDGWIRPRWSDRWPELKQSKNMSGTPYKRIAFDKYEVEEPVGQVTLDEVESLGAEWYDRL